MTYTDTQSAVYDALAVAAERIGRGNYKAQIAVHLKARRTRASFRFFVSEAHAAVVAAMPRVLSGDLTPDEGMGLLHEYNIEQERLRG